MNKNLVICCLLFSLIVIIFVYYLIKKEKISIKYGILWILLFVGMCITLLIPNLLEWLTNLLGFMAASNMIIAIFISVLIILTISLTVIVTKQDKKIRMLIQEVSLLKGKMNEK